MSAPELRAAVRAVLDLGDENVRAEIVDTFITRDLVPLVEDEHTVSLKAFIPSRNATKQYLGEDNED